MTAHAGNLRVARGLPAALSGAGLIFTSQTL